METLLKIIILLWMCIPLRVQAQLGCTTKEICTYENLFKELEETPEYIRGLGYDGTIFFFNCSNNVCTSVIVFSKKDNFLFETMFKFKCSNSGIYICTMKTEKDLLIYRFLGNNMNQGDKEKEFEQVYNKSYE